LAQINKITHNIVKNQQTNFLTSNNTNPVYILYPPKPKCRKQQTHFLTSNNTTAVRILYPPKLNCRNASSSKAFAHSKHFCLHKPVHISN